MGGPSNKVNRPGPGYKVIQRQKRTQLKANPPANKTKKGTFSGGMSKNRRAKGVVKKRKVNVSTNSTPSGKRLRKLLKARLRDEREANTMQVEFTSLPGKQRRKTSKSQAGNPSEQSTDREGCRNERSLIS